MKRAFIIKNIKFSNKKLTLRDCKETKTISEIDCLTKKFPKIPDPESFEKR